MRKRIKKYFEDFQRLLLAYLNSGKKILWVAGKDAFLFILIFILLNVVIGEILFYKYVLLVKIKEPVITAAPTKFKDDGYQSVLREWQKKENILKDSLRENYSNPFLQK